MTLQAKQALAMLQVLLLQVFLDSTSSCCYA